MLTIYICTVAVLFGLAVLFQSEGFGALAVLALVAPPVTLCCAAAARYGWNLVS